MTSAHRFAASSSNLAYNSNAPDTSGLLRSLSVQSSRLALRWVLAAASVAAAGFIAPGEAWAQCAVGATTVSCDNTSTTNTTFPANTPNDRNYQGNLPVPVVVIVNPGMTVSGNGIAVSNAGNGGITVTSNGAISVDGGNMPSAGGTAALSVTATGGPVTYTGGGITNNGNGNAFDVVQAGGVGSINLNISGPVSAAAGSGVVIRDVATSTGMSITTGAVTALAPGQNAIDAHSQALTGNIIEVANGDLRAGNAGMVAAIFPGAATGNIDVTANGSLDARFGVDAENFGTGATQVTTVGPVTATSGNGIFALSTGGAVTVNAGDVTSTGNTAIIAQQTSGAGTSAVNITTGAVSGTTGIVVTNNGAGSIGIVTHGTVTGTAAEGILATGNGAVSVLVDQTVTGATRGLSLVGGTGSISVTGTGGFVGSSGDAANILNNGNGAVTVNISGASISAGGNGFVVRDTALGTGMSITTGAVSALTPGHNAIDAQSQSLTGGITEVANYDVWADNAGMVAAIFPAAAIGNIDITARRGIDGRFGVDAENFGTGSTNVTTVGPVNATTGNGILALATGGAVTVNARSVTSSGNTAIIAQQTSAAGSGAVNVTTGNVSGTTGIVATNNGSGAIRIVAQAPVTGTAAEGILATGNGAVDVTIYNGARGATRGLSVVGGTGGTGDITAYGDGGFVGGSGDAANILNTGNGTIAVFVTGASSSAGGNGFVVRDTALGTGMYLQTGAVTALTAGKNAIDAQSQSLTGGITEIANGYVQAGNAGMVAAIFPATATGDIRVDAYGAINARFGVDAENFGTGTTRVTTFGPVTATTGNGIFTLSAGGEVTVNAGAVTSSGNTAIVAQQTGAGAVNITTGAVSGTTGIVATNNGSGAIGIVTYGTVTGTAAEGILATGNGAMSVLVDQAVTGGTRGLSLVGGAGGTGNISVTGTGGFVGGSGDAANILSKGNGAITVNISGASSSAGGNGFVVRDTALGTGMSITTGAVTALTPGRNAIDAQSQSLTGNITEVANGNLRTGNAGMVAIVSGAPATGNIDLTANGSVEARLGIYAENRGSGSTTVASVGPVIATDGVGIGALSTGGAVTVIAGDVSSITGDAILAVQTSAARSGAISVTAGTVSGMTGIDAYNFGTGTVDVIAHGTVTGTIGAGIVLGGSDAITVVVDQTVTGETRGLRVLRLPGGAGNVSVTGTGGFFGGTEDAVSIFNKGSGAVILDVSGASGSTDGNGFVVRDTAVGGPISVATGAVTALTAGQNAIDVQSQSLTGNVTEVANGNVQAGNAGIVAAILPAAATGTINVTVNGSIDARFGVDAENFGTGSTSVATVGPVTATTGNGIFALATGGNVTVATGSVTSTGNTAIIAQQVNTGGAGAVNVTAGNTSGTTGIIANNVGSGAVRISGVGTITGTTADAISAASVSGNVDVLGTGTATGANNGITATSTSGNVTIAGTGAVTASNGYGMFGLSDSGNVVIGPASTVTATGGPGIHAQVNGNGDATVTSSGTVTSTSGIGIVAATNNGVATVNASGRVAGATTGIFATALGSGSALVNVNANVATTNGVGVLATLQGAGAGTIMVNQGVNSLITATNGHGIQTNSGTSTGATTISVAGEIRRAGTGNAGLRGISTAGNITVNVATTGRIDPDFGIALNTVNGALTVNNAGLVTGTVTGVRLVATGTGTATINNSGTITGPNAVVGSLNGGSFTLANLGTLNGSINVSGAGVATSTWTNAVAATANLGSGASAFSGNLVNAGIADIGAGGTLSILGATSNSGRANFAGAGSFTTGGAMANSGIINAQNNLTTNVVTVGGNYTGGGQFFADYSTVTATADRLNIAGTASGNTNVTLNRVGTRSFVPGGFLPVVTVAPGAAASAFTSNTVFETTGFILDSFGRNPANSTQVGLIQTVNPVAAPLGALTYMAEAGSDTLDEPISPFVTMRNDPPPGATRVRLWMRGGGGHTNERISSTFAGGGVTYTNSSRLHIEHTAAQVGADLGFLNLGGGGWSVNVGVTGGWYGARVAVSPADRIKVETPFLGGYVVVGDDAAMIEGVVRKEWRHYKLAMPTLFGAGGTQKVDGGATAWMLRGSYRIGSTTGFAATPFASFHYADSDIDPLAVDASTAWTPGSDRTKVGQAGLRLSWRGGSLTGVMVEPFASAARLENWANRDSSSFAFGTPATNFSLDMISWRNAMRYSAGVIGKAADGRISGFLTGNVDDGSRLKRFTLNAGVRFNF